MPKLSTMSESSPAPTERALGFAELRVWLPLLISVLFFIGLVYLKTFPE